LWQIAVLAGDGTQQPSESCGETIEAPVSHIQRLCQCFSTSLNPAVAAVEYQKAIARTAATQIHQANKNSQQIVPLL